MIIRLESFSSSPIKKSPSLSGKCIDKQSLLNRTDGGVGRQSYNV